MRTRKPCPGCGVVTGRRPAESVCHDCKKLMEDGKTFRDSMAKSREFEPVILPWAHYSLPYLYYAGDYAEKIQKVLIAMARFVGTDGPSTLFKLDTPTLIDGTRDQSSSERSQEILLPKGLRVYFNELYKLIIAAGDNAYREGHDRGSNLLVELCENKESLQDFNERVIRSGLSGSKPHVVAKLPKRKAGKS